MKKQPEKLTAARTSHWPLLIAALTLGAAPLATPPATASEELFQNAVVEDRMMGDIRERLATLQERKEESRIFSAAEIQGDQAMGETVGKVKDKEVRSIIAELGESTKAADQARRAGHYESARGHYITAVEALEKLRRQAGKAEAAADRQQAIEKQRELLEETQKLEAELNRGEKTPETAATDAMKLASEQQELAAEQQRLNSQPEAPPPTPKTTPTDPIAQKMTDAAKNLNSLDLPKAEQRQQEALAAMEKQLAEQTAGEQQPAEQAANLQELQDLASGLAEMEQQLGDSATQQQPMGSQERQEMAGKMDTAAQQMEKLGLGPAEQKMEQAMGEMMENKDAQAQGSVKDARQQVEAALGQAREQARQMAGKPQPGQPPGPPQPQSPESPAQATDSKEHSSTGSQLAAKGGQGPGGADWAARLPPRERGALLSARQAKYPDLLDAEVKKYFLEIAK
ncbi:MAG: hypothetical protein WC789_06250 [Lentisphaeria bacterium]|jgi:hypothetical protein